MITLNGTQHRENLASAVTTMENATLAEESPDIASPEATAQGAPASADSAAPHASSNEAPGASPPQPSDPLPPPPPPLPPPARRADSVLFHDALETLQGLANAMLDPFDLAMGPQGAGGRGGGGVQQLQRQQAGDGGGSDQQDHDYDYDNFDVGAVFGGKRVGPPSARRRRLVVAVPPALSGPEAIVLRDKVAFVLGLSLTWTMAYWLGWSPSTFYQLYAALTVLLGATRWVSYRSKRWHYYMLDFCYMANALLLVHCFIAPRSRALNKITFAFNAGPLAWSILAFRNSLVLHSLDKVTSVYMHIAPALVSWTLRWKPDHDRFGPGPGAAQQEEGPWPGPAGFVDLVLLPIPVYVSWALAYYLKIFVVSAERIRERGYATLFTYVSNTEKKGVYAAIARRVHPDLRPPVYLLLHLCFCCFTMSVSILAWRSFVAHTLLIAAICCTSMWHGATYYFEFFSRKYLDDVQQRTSRGNNGAADGPAKESKAARARTAAESRHSKPD